VLHIALSVLLKASLFVAVSHSVSQKKLAQAACKHSDVADVIEPMQRLRHDPLTRWQSRVAARGPIVPTLRTVSVAGRRVCRQVSSTRSSVSSVMATATHFGAPGCSSAASWLCRRSTVPARAAPGCRYPSSGGCRDTFASGDSPTLRSESMPHGTAACTESADCVAASPSCTHQPVIFRTTEPHDQREAQVCPADPMQRTGGCSSFGLPDRRWGAADCRWTTIAAGRAASPRRTPGPRRASHRTHLPAPCVRTLLLGCTAAWALPAGNLASPQSTASSGLVCCCCLTARRFPGRGPSHHAPEH